MLAGRRTDLLRLSSRPCRECGTTQTNRRITTVPTLPSRDPKVFGTAYKEDRPARLPRSRAHLPPACTKWFIHDNNSDFELLRTFERGDDDREFKIPSSSELRTAFWADHESLIVPLEITTKKNDGTESFECIETSLGMLLAYLSHTATSPTKSASEQLSIYLAQCDLSSLPASLQADVPVPALLRPSSTTDIKGDTYASSLWLGRAPTYTPLHRDPNPNLFIQLAGQKTIRLLPPEIGEALFDDVQSTLSFHSFSSKIRGEEMMAGPQKEALHSAVWEQSSKYAQLMQDHGLETTLGLGDALFTPKGWWHSVKGVGKGITGSVNWWFR